MDTFVFGVNWTTNNWWYQLVGVNLGIIHFIRNLEALAVLTELGSGCWVSSISITGTCYTRALPVFVLNVRIRVSLFSGEASVGLALYCISISLVVVLIEIANSVLAYTIFHVSARGPAERVLTQLVISCLLYGLDWLGVMLRKDLIVHW